MPTVNSNAVSLTLTSTWTCTWADDDHNSTYVSKASTTDTQGASFSATVPAGATITGRTLKTTWSNTGVVQTAQVDGAALGASVDSRAVSSMAHNYTWRASAAAMGSQGDYSRYMYVSAYIEVTYTDPPPGESDLSLNSQHINAGYDVIATISPKSSGYWHRFAVWLGSESYTVDTAENSATFTIPMSWLAQIPNAAVGMGGAWLQTFSGATQIGVTKYLDLYIYAPASVVPTLTGVTATLASNGVDASITRYVKNYSKCLLEITGAAGAYNSTISSYKITGGVFTVNAVSGAVGPFGTSGDLTFTATITDSRGRTASATVTITVDAYNFPSLTDISAFRCDVNGTADRAGAYVLLKATPNTSSVGGQNSAALAGRVYMKGGTPGTPETMTSNTASILGGGLLLPVKTYMAEIIVQDLINTYAYTATIPTDVVGLHILDKALGGGIGKYGETPGMMEVAWPLSAPSLYGHRNILHNYDFRNPVNKRAVSGAISTGGYFYDRWILNSGTVTTNADYLTIGASAEIKQRIEGNLLAGETVTASVMVGGTVFSGTGIMPTSSGTVSVTVTGWGTATLGYATGYMYVRLSPTAASNVVRVKLEMGTVSTLAYDPPMDYGAELLKCQRYLKRFEGDFARMVSYTPDILYFAMIQATAFRITPTLVGSCSVYTISGALHTGFYITAAYTAYGTFMMLAQKTAHGLTDARLWANPAGVFLLSAEL